MTFITNWCICNSTIFFFSFKAFPQEFTIIENDAACNDHRAAVLQSFSRPDVFANEMLKKSAALSDCEMYCSLYNECWGCLRVCNGTCQWKAITYCRHSNSIAEYVENSLSKKPGIIINSV